MMKIIFLLFLMISFSVSGEEITNESFKGKWCGKWDNIYSTCIIINNVESGSIAKYQWQEQPHGKFKKSKKAIKRINKNTLKIDNIWFVIDETNLERAYATGIFRIQSRFTRLEKELVDTN